MKQSKIVFLINVALFLYSCSHQPNEKVERVSISPQVVSADLMTSMPGTLLVYDHILIWSDATSSGYIHVIDRNSGKEIKQLQVKGEGPGEVITPGICWAQGNQLAIFDYNGSKKIVTSLKEVGKNEDLEKEIIKLDNRFLGSRVISLENGQDVLVTIDSLRPFLLVSDSLEIPFGSYPLSEIDDIDNRFDVLQGEVAYNPFSGKLLHSIGQLSYMALYNWDGTKFELDKEKRLSKVDYITSGKSLIIKDTPRYAPTAIAITKDYIVSIEKDKKVSSSSSGVTQAMGNGRVFSKAPHTVFVYDYNLEIKKIIDIGMPVFRIAADYVSNKVYLIGVNPDFCIVTFEIP